jgi:hypothetical protein
MTFPAITVLAMALSVTMLAPVAAASPHFWRVESPDHGQTFAYGSIRHRAWFVQGRDQHLALTMDLTNDPYVDNTNPRQYDTFVFNFPSVKLGKDGRTFYHHDGEGHSVPVAIRKSGFLGIEEINLLSNASLIIDKPHGYLSLSLAITSASQTAESDDQ